MKNCLFVSIVLLFAVSIGYAQVTIHVPGDQPTIQAGIDVAVDGDVVLVAEGTYYENINFLGKAITVTSHYYLDGKERHIKKTIIDGSQPANPDFGSVVSFVSGEDTNSVLRGFTITGGTGTLEFPPGMPPMREGGGVFCSASGARIVHNIIKNNRSEIETGMSWGGGFASSPPFIPTFVILENNVFERNFISGSIATGGGGVSFCSSGRIVKNTFINNTVYAEEGGGATGGGIVVQSWSAPTPANVVFMSDNIITHNKALQSETATFWLGGNGGGISILATKGTFVNNIIQHNEVNAVNSSFAPGVLFDFPPDEIYFRNNIVSHNTYSGAGYCYGGGFAIWDGNPTIENNLFEKNDATFGGGGWIGDAFSFAKIINNTIIKNHAEQKGGALYTKDAEPIVMNSILWNNHAPEGSEIYVESGTIDVTYSDIQGGWIGTGNINVNPKLISDISLLNHKSPCIDAGNPDMMYNDPEDPMNLGHALYPAQGFLMNDMGAYGGPGAAYWYDLLEGDSFENEPEIVPILSSDELKIDNYPNPFNPQTTIKMILPKDGFVSLKIYNVLGQEVTTLVSDNLTAGSYEYVWNARNLASGIYIYRLEANGLAMDKKMILMK